MKQSIKAFPFLSHVFDDERTARQAAAIVEGMLAAQSPRLARIAQHMPGTPAANYKAIQRFIRRVDLPAQLWRLFQSDAEFVIGDPTEIARPEAYKTSYVGKLKDGKTRGFWLLLLATPFRGRALPCGFVSYSSRTIAQTLRSRNQYHWLAFDQLKTLLGDKPLVLDREFSYLELLHYLRSLGLNFVIRLHMGNHPSFFDAAGQRITPVVDLGGEATYYELRYLGQVPVHVIGVWRIGHAEPLWIMTSLAPEHALRIYAARTQIEESFRDLKSLLHLDQLMNRTQRYMEQMVALMLLAFSLGLVCGEIVRDARYGAPTPHDPPHPPSAAQRKWQRYSGFFILLKETDALSATRWRQLQRQALERFVQLVTPDPVPP
jgi:hypothetical protein